MEEKIINMIQSLIDMQKEYQKKNEKDIQSVKTELKEDMAELRTELKRDMAELRTELKRDMVELRTELKGDMAELRTDVTTLKSDMVEVKSDIKTLKTDVNTLKGQRMIDTNNLALVLNQQTKMMKMLEDIYGNTSELNYVM